MSSAIRAFQNARRLAKDFRLDQKNQYHLGMVNRIAFKTYKLLWKESKPMSLLFFGTYNWKILFETIHIAPIHTFGTELIIFAHICSPITARFYAHTKHEPKEYISLLRVPLVPVLKMACDWCSIINGYIAYVRDALVWSLSSINKNGNGNGNENENENEKGKTATKRGARVDVEPTEAEDQKEALQYLSSLSSKKWWLKFYKSLPLCSSNWDRAKFAKIVPQLFPELDFASTQNEKYTPYMLVLETFCGVYNAAQSYEPRWCPFKHLEKIRTEPDPLRYGVFLDGSTWNNILLAGKIIQDSQFKSVSCENCANIINEYQDPAKLGENETKKEEQQFIQTVSAKDYIDMQPYVDALTEISTSSSALSV